MATEKKPFWQQKTLSQMTQTEWESLCDGCGLCCLQKLEDDTDGQVYYTRIACKLLDLDQCRCSDYDNRFAKVPHCLQLTPTQTEDFVWLPKTCAYRLVAEGKDLPEWHHLISGDRDAVHRAGVSLAGQMFHDDAVPEDDWEDYIVWKEL